jgi:hypothetical protein
LPLTATATPLRKSRRVIGAPRKDSLAGAIPIVAEAGYETSDANPG